MARGISMHVGVNFTSVSTTPLLGCVNDAMEMALIAEEHGFEGREVIANSQATFSYVTNKIKDAATRLSAGDIFFFTFSGHGSYMPDEDFDETDYRDETLVLHDLMLSDDVLARDLWPRFAAGVRILMVSDSCFSGTVSQRIAPPKSDRNEENAGVETRRIADDRDTRIPKVRSGMLKMIPNEDRLRHLARNKDLYEKMFRDLPEKPVVTATVLLFAACEDSDTTADGFPNSVFTQTVLDVVRRRSPPTSYTQLRTDVAALLVSTQVPQLTVFGPDAVAFEAQGPFTT
ncbi:MAG TPA: caspase family protein [Pyrinomonadaceae bacterium]|nr:caspase family protein [Pyrinomonadaceae bacterium]